MIKSSWSRTMFTVLFAAALPMHVCPYKVLMIPFYAKAHIFSMTAIAEGLADRGHKVTLFVGENYRFSLPELKNRAEISVVRYRDTTDGAKLDYDAMYENYVIKSHIESGSSTKQQMDSTINNLYVHFIGNMT